jgi:hypothetical protein
MQCSSHEVFSHPAEPGSALASKVAVTPASLAPPSHTGSPEAVKRRAPHRTRQPCRPARRLDTARCGGWPDALRRPTRAAHAGIRPLEEIGWWRKCARESDVARGRHSVRDPTLTVPSAPSVAPFRSDRRAADVPTGTAGVHRPSRSTQSGHGIERASRSQDAVSARASLRHSTRHDVGRPRAAGGDERHRRSLGA